MPTVLMIQVVAALLLLLGSALIFRALLEIDASAHPRPKVRTLPRPSDAEVEERLPRAA